VKFKKISCIIKTVFVKNLEQKFSVLLKYKLKLKVPKFGDSVFLKRLFLSRKFFLRKLPSKKIPKFRSLTYHCCHYIMTRF